MILTCPACATSYFVPDDAIGAGGRRVRCKSCSHVWRAEPEEQPLDLAPSEPEPPAPVEAPPVDIMTSSLPESTAPELPKAFRAKAEQKRRMQKAAREGATWVGMILVLVALIAAALAFRLPIVKAWPQTASLYELVGFKVNITGVDVEALRGRVLLHAPDRVAVGGALRNITDNEVVPPTLAVILKDDQGREVSRRLVRPDGPPILPGQVRGFGVVLPNPEGKGTGISTLFPLQPRDQTQIEPPAATTAASDTSSPQDDGGLRQVSPLETSGG